MFKDSRKFGRMLAGGALIAAPILFLIGTFVDPAWGGDTDEYLQEVADAEGRYLLAGILSLVGALLLVPGLIGVIHLLRRRNVTLGQVGAALVLIGVIAIATTYIINVIEIEAVDDQYNREQMVEFIDNLEESSGAAPIFVMFLLGLVLGSILLAIGLWRQRAVHWWVPLALVASTVASFVGGDSQGAAIVSSVILAAALIGLGLKILSVSDDDWERWEVLPDPKAARPEPEKPEQPVAA